MSDYISREDVIKKIAEIQDKATTGIEDVAYYRAIKIIRDMPAADVQPVKRGSWIAENRDNRRYADCYTCTNCHCYIYTYTLMKACDFDFCPNCGARMTEEGDAE